jgi:hypothetical protein
MSDTVRSSDAEPIELLRDVPIFLCYRGNDGSFFAEWLYKRLNGIEYLDSAGHRCRIRAYCDKTAPGVSDWKSLHFPSLQTTRALLVICTPGIAKDLSDRGSPRLGVRRTTMVMRKRGPAPIVVDTTGEGERWLPDLLTKNGFLSALEPIDDRDVRSRLLMLRSNVAADVAGATRAHPCDLSRP